MIGSGTISSLEVLHFLFHRHQWAKKWPIHLRTCFSECVTELRRAAGEAVNVHRVIDPVRIGLASLQKIFWLQKNLVQNVSKQHEHGR